MGRAKKDPPLESPAELAAFCRGCEAVECVKIEVRHLVSGQEATNVVATFEGEDDGTGADRFNAEDIYTRLLIDAESYGGIQRYVLLAFRAGSRTPRERFPLQLDGGGDGAGGLSEGANAAGLVGQAHRHLEGVMRTFCTAMKQCTDSLVQQNKQLADQNSKLIDERGEMWELISGVYKQDREKLELNARIKRDDQRQDVMRRAVELALPGLVNKILPSETAKVSGVMAFIESLNDQQMKAIFDKLTPEQSMALASLIDTHESKKPKESGSKKEEEAAE